MKDLAGVITMIIPIACGCVHHSCTIRHSPVVCRKFPFYLCHHPCPDDKPRFDEYCQQYTGYYAYPESS